MSVIAATKAIKGIGDSFSYFASKGFSAEGVYRDWAACFALAIANGSDPMHGETWERRENQYLEIVHRYPAEAVREHFPRMCACLTEAFEKEPFEDYLGCLYMEMCGTAKSKKNGMGQCFTPIDVCRACAITTLGDIDPNGTDTITINDPAVGGGAMLIAACGYLKERGINYQKRVRFYANDLDLLCVHMCYIQMTLLGARAIVEHKDTITQKCYDRFVTPMEALYPAFLLADVKIATESKA